MYPKEITEPIREELIEAGIKELKTTEDVDLAFKNKNFLLVVNSVCGCSGSSMRPGVIEALDEHSVLTFSVFAGVDLEATSYARSLIKGFEPSSPSVFLIKDGEVLFALERHDIQSRHFEDIKEELLDAFSKHNI
jgi:putative YphP/YqiW family bacilliredoxin